ncbi:hypothetical protein U1708_05030 [Sphingomonas sp. ZB1N12]|uniref:hypothetical protein n=1 Tax=Sphingomonas arabinosi TaxID=3096160 RepID=UPI002FCBB09C
MDLLMRFWLTIRHSGWFESSATGGIFPFAWQAWAIMAAFMAAIAASVVLHGEAAWLTRIILCVGYIAFGIATYE